MKTQWTKLNVCASVLVAACAGLSVAPEMVYADDFGRIVHHIEASYHVHRSHRFVLGCVGLVVRFWHVGGIKNLKLAIFENQDFTGTETDKKLDELVSRASRSGWQPVVRSYSRLSGERSYIYAQNDGTDLKLLIVNLNPDEAEVIQVKADSNRLEHFVGEALRGSGRHGHSAFDRGIAFL